MTLRKPSAKAKIHTKPILPIFLGDKCLNLLGEGGRGEESEGPGLEGGGGNRRAAAEPCSLRAGATWRK